MDYRIQLGESNGRWGESSFVLRGVRSDSHFSMKVLCANRIAPDWCRLLRRHIWGYVACLCPIKGTPGLHEIILQRFTYSVNMYMYQYVQHYFMQIEIKEMLFRFV